MFNFNMKVEENFASFFDMATKKKVLVESYDNKKFEVRYGTLIHTIELGVIEANNDKELNQLLADLTHPQKVRELESHFNI